ncbi:MAG: ComZ family protein [Bacillota bacterium]
MSDEKLRILEMIESGKLSAAEGLELLKALDEPEPKPATAPSQLSKRFLRVRIDSAGATKVNVNVPLSLIKVASKFAGIGMKFIPEEARLEMEKKGIDLSQINFEELLSLIEQGLSDGKLVDIDINDPDEGRVKVEVYVD